MPLINNNNNFIVTIKSETRILYLGVEFSYWTIDVNQDKCCMRTHAHHTHTYI